MTKQTCRSSMGLVCGITAEAMQENKNILDSLSVVIYKNKRNAAGSDDNVLHICFKRT